MNARIGRVVIVTLGLLVLLAAFSPTQAQDQFPYVDNRSAPDMLMVSYINAINRHEYVRAYSYWEAGGPPNQTYSQFEQGYANTQSVQLILGVIGGDAGAGNVYYLVPMTFIVQLTNGTSQTFVGCYTLHLLNPDNWGAPPFIPMGIMTAQVRQVANNANTTSLMAQACPAAADYPATSTSPTPTVDPASIDASRYLDDRSDGIQVLRSLFNAINSHQYVRAYSYWDESAITSGEIPTFDKFQQGYASTQSVQLTTGTMGSDAGAGQVYYSIPVTLVARTTTGAIQTYVGCYVTHLSQPSIQGAPPFHPMSIVKAKVRQVANNANTASLMAQACTNVP